MILVNLELTIGAEHRERWLGELRRYADEVRREPGCLFFDCFESIDTPNDFAVIEGFESGAAGERHTRTEHFQRFIGFMAAVVSGTPRIINVEAPQDGWSAMSELDAAREPNP